VKQKRKQTFKKSQESQSSLTTAEQSLAKAQSKAQTKRITIIAPGGMPLKVNPGQTFIVNKDPAKPSIEIEDTEAKCMAAELHERLNGPGIMTPPRLRPETAGPRKRTGPKRDPEVAKRRVIVDKCSEKDLGVCKNLDFEGCKPPSGWGGGDLVGHCLPKGQRYPAEGSLAHRKGPERQSEEGQLTQIIQTVCVSCPNRPVSPLSIKDLPDGFKKRLSFSAPKWCVGRSLRGCKSYCPSPTPPS